MIGLIVCNESDYCGICQLNCLAEHLDSKKLGSDIEAFINNYIDEDTQTIKYSTYANYDAQELCSKISEYSDQCRVIIFADCDESFDTNLLKFIGFDVCADDYYTSPIGMGLLSSDISEYDIYEFEPFFENISNEVRYEYEQQLNEYGLFDSNETADEIAEYCNWLNQEDEDAFNGAENFKTIRIYMNA